jgi:hypothetical protein
METKEEKVDFVDKEGDKKREIIDLLMKMDKNKERPTDYIHLTDEAVQKRFWIEIDMLFMKILEETNDSQGKLMEKVKKTIRDNAQLKLLGEMLISAEIIDDELMMMDYSMRAKGRFGGGEHLIRQDIMFVKRMGVEVKEEGISDVEKAKDPILSHPEIVEKAKNTKRNDPNTKLKDEVLKTHYREKMNKLLTSLKEKITTINESLESLSCGPLPKDWLKSKLDKMGSLGEDDQLVDIIKDFKGNIEYQIKHDKRWNTTEAELEKASVP